MSQQDTKKDLEYQKGRQQAADAIDATKDAAEKVSDKAQGTHFTQIGLFKYSVLKHFAFPFLSVLLLILCIEVIDDGKEVVAEKKEEAKGIFATLVDTIGAVAASVVGGNLFIVFFYSFINNLLNILFLSKNFSTLLPIISTACLRQ
jgi:hypothetical protein